MMERCCIGHQTVSAVRQKWLYWSPVDSAASVTSLSLDCLMGYSLKPQTTIEIAHGAHFVSYEWCTSDFFSVPITDGSQLLNQTLLHMTAAQLFEYMPPSFEADVVCGALWNFGFDHSTGLGLRQSWLPSLVSCVKPFIEFSRDRMIISANWICVIYGWAALWWDVLQFDL